jgi:hypothetical protein
MANLRKLRIVASALLLLAAVYRVSIAEDRVYLGILHSHTSYSDGSGVPQDAYTRARAVGLNFLAITEHNHAKQIKPKDRDGVPIGVDHTLYNGPGADSLLNTARRLTEDGQFVALYVQEFSAISSGKQIIDGWYAWHHGGW